MKNLLPALLTLLTLNVAHATVAITSITREQFMGAEIFWQGIIGAGSHNGGTPIENIGLGPADNFHISLGFQFEEDIPYKWEFTLSPSGMITLELNDVALMNYTPAEAWDDLLFGIDVSSRPSLLFNLSDVTLNGELLGDGTFTASSGESQFVNIPHEALGSAMHLEGNLVFSAEDPFIAGGFDESLRIAGTTVAPSPEPSALLLLGAGALVILNRRKR